MVIADYYVFLPEHWAVHNQYHLITALLEDNLSLQIWRARYCLQAAGWLVMARALYLCDAGLVLLSPVLLSTLIFYLISVI